MYITHMNYIHLGYIQLELGHKRERESDTYLLIISGRAVSLVLTHL